MLQELDGREGIAQKREFWEKCCRFDSKTGHVLSSVIFHY